MSEKTKVKTVWLQGSYLRRREILSKIKQRFADADCVICSGDITIEYVISEIQNTSCFNSRKIIIINSMPIIESSNKSKVISSFRDILKNLDESIFVVFNGIDSTKYKSLYSCVEENGKIYNFEETLNAANAASWVSEQFNALGYKISEENAEFLVKNSGWDESLNAIGRDVLEMSIKSIALYCNKTKEINEDHISVCSFPSTNFIIWDLVSALDNKDYDKSVMLIEQSVVLEDSYLNAMSQILPMLIWRYRMLLFLRECLTISHNKDKALQDALLMRKLSQKGSGNNMHMSVDYYKSGENKDKPASAWGYNVLSMALNGSYGQNPVIDSYSRRDLFNIVQTLNSILLSIRQYQSESVAKIASDVLCMTVCRKLDENLIGSLKNYCMAEI